MLFCFRIDYSHISIHAAKNQGFCRWKDYGRTIVMLDSFRPIWYQGGPGDQSRENRLYMEIRRYCLALLSGVSIYYHLSAITSQTSCSMKLVSTTYPPVSAIPPGSETRHTGCAYSRKIGLSISYFQRKIYKLYHSIDKIQGVVKIWTMLRGSLWTPLG